jgi:hypothetical protein
VSCGKEKKRKKEEKTKKKTASVAIDARRCLIAQMLPSYSCAVRKLYGRRFISMYRCNVEKQEQG